MKLCLRRTLVRLGILLSFYRSIDYREVFREDTNQGGEKCIEECVLVSLFDGKLKKK